MESVEKTRGLGETAHSLGSGGETVHQLVEMHKNCYRALMMLRTEEPTLD